MAELTVDGYTQLLRKLKRLAPETNKELRKELRSLSDEVAQDARTNAGWSNRIPAAIGVTVTNKGAGVKVSRKKAPHGSLFERGNAGARSAASFRHPVFGQNVYVSQPTRPFIQPAVDAREPELVTRAEQALRDAVRKAGW